MLRLRFSCPWRCALLLPGLLVASAALAQDATQPYLLGADLPGLLSHARTHSPELNAMRLEADAAAQRIAPAGALPDPVLRVEMMNVNNYGTDAAPSPLPWRVGETRYTLMQSLPGWGKRALRQDAMAAEARQAMARAEATWIELATRIKAAYAEYYRASANQALTHEVLDLAARLEQAAQARYARGLVPQQDVLRAQLERSGLQAELIALEAELRQARARLNALMARDGAAPLATPQALRPVPPLVSADKPALAQRARAGNPLIGAEQARLEAAQKNHELSQRNRNPDVVVGVSPSQMRSRITTWGVMLELNIPLQQDTRRSQERESGLMVEAARSRAQAVSHQLLGELGVMLAALDAARRTEDLLVTQWLPQSELGLQSTLAAYERGKADFVMVLEAQRQIRKARQELLKARVDTQLRLADIERIVGGDL